MHLDKVKYDMKNARKKNNFLSNLKKIIIISEEIFIFMENNNMLFYVKFYIVMLFMLFKFLQHFYNICQLYIMHLFNKTIRIIDYNDNFKVFVIEFWLLLLDNLQKIFTSFPRQLAFFFFLTIIREQ